MSIGETLAQARRWSGLSVTEVSQRTRIRETLVKDIERDDYSACGGDFYTRGHIRAIARVVGADPEPLIEEYDAARARRTDRWKTRCRSHRRSGRGAAAAATRQRDRLPPTVTRERVAPPRPGGPQPAAQRPQPPGEPADGAPLRISPDRPDGWQEPPRGTAASGRRPRGCAG